VQSRISELNYEKMNMQHLGSNACIIFIFSVMLIFRVNAFSFETVTKVTKDVIMKYNSICVYLMHSDHQQGVSVFCLILFLPFGPKVCYFVLSVSLGILVSANRKSSWHQLEGTFTCVLYYSPLTKGARGGAVVEALRYKPEGRGIDSRWCYWNFSLT
jgi:hypothetical protein